MCDASVVMDSCKGGSLSLECRQWVGVRDSIPAKVTLNGRNGKFTKMKGKGMAISGNIWIYYYPSYTNKHILSLMLATSAKHSNKKIKTFHLNFLMWKTWKIKKVFSL